MPTVVVTSPDGDHDIGAPQVKNTAAPTTLNTNTLYAGGILSGKFVVYEGVFMRFDAGIPAGATIDAVRLEIHPIFSVNAGLVITMAFGWIDKDGRWDAAGAFANYTLMNQFPWAEWANGASQDATVWVDNAPAWEDDWTIRNAGTSFRIGSGGSHTYDVPAPGLLTQLQSYVAAEGSDAPFCFHMFRRFDIVSQRYQAFHSRDSASSHPTLTVDYTEPAFGPISGRGASSLAVSGRGRSTHAVSERGGVAPSVSGRLRTTEAVSGRGASAPAVSGRGKTR